MEPAVLETPETAGKADNERVLGSVGPMGGHDAQGHGNS
jgi:hypothetical protein